jgi:CDGSH-type Zn-finger protein
LFPAAFRSRSKRLYQIRKGFHGGGRKGEISRPILSITPAGVGILKTKPFCDGTHEKIHFEGMETG